MHQTCVLILSLRVYAPIKLSNLTNVCKRNLISQLRHENQPHTGQCGLAVRVATVSASSVASDGFDSQLSQAKMLRENYHPPPIYLTTCLLLVGQGKDWVMWM